MTTQQKTFPRNGEVWLLNTPNQPNDPHQPRTAIVVSTTGRNEFASDVIVVPTTSSIGRPHPRVHVHIPAGEGGLRKDSYARCDQITTIDKVLLERGPLGPPIHLSYRWRIVNAVRSALGDNFL